MHYLQTSRMKKIRKKELYKTLN